jgi:hypothetical protein
LVNDDFFILDILNKRSDAAKEDDNYDSDYGSYYDFFDWELIASLLIIDSHFV